jgi:nicotinamidase-related amidase
MSSSSTYIAPQYERSALVTIDLQRDFLSGRFEIVGTAAVVPAIARLVQCFRMERRPIIHVVRLYQPDGSNVDPSRRRLIEEGTMLVRPGTTGAQIAAPLLPAPDTVLDSDALLNGEFQVLGPQEWAMYKPRWGAFFGTALEAHLRRLEVSTLVFAGCNFPNCPRTSIYEASERDFRIVAVDDAISGLYEQGREELRGIGVSVVSTAKVIAGVF